MKILLVALLLVVFVLPADGACGSLAYWPMVSVISRTNEVTLFLVR